MKGKLKYYFSLIKQHQRNIEAAVIVIVIAAVLLFGPKGEKDNNSLKDGKESRQKAVAEEQLENEKDKAAEKPAEKKYTEAHNERMYADISGCVVNPGIYSINRDTRLFELIASAGGLTEEADYNGFNQAEIVEDGDKIIIPSKADMEAGITSGYTVNQESGIDKDGKININTAGLEQLDEIPGVGPSTAERIIAYREENGRFHHIEDLMNISGIGPKTFDKMKESITV